MDNVSGKAKVVDAGYTVDAILEALQQQQESGDGCLTTREIARLSGLSYYSILRGLHVLQEKGTLIVEQVKRVSLTGRRVLVPAYKVRKEGLKSLRPASVEVES